MWSRLGSLPAKAQAPDLRMRRHKVLVIGLDCCMVAVDSSEREGGVLGRMAGVGGLVFEGSISQAAVACHAYNHQHLYHPHYSLQDTITV